MHGQNMLKLSCEAKLMMDKIQKNMLFHSFHAVPAVLYDLWIF